jgi:ammonium transporter, Amt family
VARRYYWLLVFAGMQLLAGQALGQTAPANALGNAAAIPSVAAKSALASSAVVFSNRLAAAQPGSSMPFIDPQPFLSAFPALSAFITLLGTALYFGALVRTKNTLSTMAQVLLSSCAATVVWIAIAGDLSLAEKSASWLASLTALQNGIPAVADQVVAALPMVVLTSAVLFGGAVERLRFVAVALIAPLWTLLVLAPLLRAVHEKTGLLATLGFNDWIGVGALHIAAGVSAFVISVATGSRHGYGRVAFPPYHIPLALVGALVMITGWTLGFVASGAALTTIVPGSAATKLFIAATAGLATWAAIESVHRRVASSLGMVSGTVAGVVACSTVAAWISPRGAVAVGVLGAVVGYFGAVVLRRVHQRDESLDVFALHTLPAVAGLLALPILSTSIRAEFSTQLAATILIIIYAVALTALVVLPLKFFGWLRVSFDEEDAGLDLIAHGETVHPPQSTL